MATFTSLLNKAANQRFLGVARESNLFTVVNMQAAQKQNEEESVSDEGNVPQKSPTLRRQTTARQELSKALGGEAYGAQRAMPNLIPDTMAKMMEDAQSSYSVQDSHDTLDAVVTDSLREPLQSIVKDSAGPSQDVKWRGFVLKRTTDRESLKGSAVEPADVAPPVKEPESQRLQRGPKKQKKIYQESSTSEAQYEEYSEESSEQRRPQRHHKKHHKIQDEFTEDRRRNSHRKARRDEETRRESQASDFVLMMAPPQYSLVPAAQDDVQLIQAKKNRPDRQSGLVPVSRMERRVTQRQQGLEKQSVPDKKRPDKEPPRAEPSSESTQEDDGYAVQEIKVQKVTVPEPKGVIPGRQQYTIKPSIPTADSSSIASRSAERHITSRPAISSTERRQAVNPSKKSREEEKPVPMEQTAPVRTEYYPAADYYQPDNYSPGPLSPERAREAIKETPLVQQTQVAAPKKTGSLSSVSSLGSAGRVQAYAAGIIQKKLLPGNVPPELSKVAEKQARQRKPREKKMTVPKEAGEPKQRRGRKMAHKETETERRNLQLSSSGSFTEDSDEVSSSIQEEYGRMYDTNPMDLRDPSLLQTVQVEQYQDPVIAANPDLERVLGALDDASKQKIAGRRFAADTELNREVLQLTFDPSHNTRFRIALRQGLNEEYVYQAGRQVAVKLAFAAEKKELKEHQKTKQNLIEKLVSMAPVDDPTLTFDAQNGEQRDICPVSRCGDYEFFEFGLNSHCAKIVKWNNTAQSVIVLEPGAESNPFDAGPNGSFVWVGKGTVTVVGRNPQQAEFTLRIAEAMVLPPELIFTLRADKTEACILLSRPEGEQHYQ